MGQILGGIALVCWVLSIQMKKKDKILKMQILANLFYAGQYFLLGAFSAVSMNLVSTIRSVLYAENETKGKENSNFSFIIFINVILLLGILTYDSLLSLLPIFITLLYTYATWQKNTKVIRITFLLAAFIWIFYNSMVGAYAPLIGNVIEIISGIVSIIRFDLKKESNKN